MPMYEYVCQDCTHEFETLVFNGDEVHCPKCSGDKLERLLSVPGRPRVGASPTSLPPACNSSGPPCGSMCRRFNDS